MNFEHRLVQLRLAALAREIAAAPVSEPPPYAPTADLWAEAGTFVTADAFALTDSAAARRGELGVLTRHARPLSWLLFALREVHRAAPAAPHADEFAGRLADTANGHLAACQPEGDDWRPLLLAVLREANRAFAAAAVAEPARRGAAFRERPRPAPELAVAA